MRASHLSQRLGACRPSATTLASWCIRRDAVQRPLRRCVGGISQKPGSDQYGLPTIVASCPWSERPASCPRRERRKADNPRHSVTFPGAVKSKFTHELTFSNPASQAAMPTFRVMDAEGEIVDASRPAPDVTDAEAVKMYTDMLTVSIMDLIMFDAQRQGRLSFYMVSAGEEGIAIGSASALAPQDVIFAQYREAGVLQHRGFTLDDFMSQLFANRHDPGRGRNMPVHYGSRRLNVHTISSPLATQIPQAAGAAYALKLRHKLGLPHSPARSTADTPLPEQDAAVVACYFGEGAASEGDFHAGLNFAATRACPVLFLCRNNGYAISTTTLEQYRGDGIASRGTGYGIDTIRVDGNDVFAVREATRRARALALEPLADGHGTGRPVLLELMSYRVSHHSTSDDSFAYRARRDVEDWKRRDNPLVRLRKWLERRGLWSEAAEKEARSALRKDVLAAFQRAEREKKPPLACMWEDVYEGVTEEQRGEMRALRRIIEKYPDEYDVSEFEGGIESLPK